MSVSEYIEWDVANWSRALTFWEKHTALNNLSKPLNALEVGGRDGGLSLWLARKGINTLCTDLKGPSDKAKEKHEKSDVAHLIRHDVINALDIPYQEYFDLVAFKSVLGGIGSGDNKENQKKAIAQIYKSLKKGGELYFAENLVASPLHQILRKKYVPWAKYWRYVTSEETLSYLSQFSDVKYTTIGFLGAFGPNEKLKNTFGWLDKYFVDKIVPKSWNYIIVGVAKK